MPRRTTRGLDGKTYSHDYAPTKYFTKYAKANGYDSITFVDIIDGREDRTDFRGNVYAVFDSNQIKSADPVTYDDNGNVIPLSERFNPKNSDIRYSRELDLANVISEEVNSVSTRTLLANALADM